MTKLAAFSSITTAVLFEPIAQQSLALTISMLLSSLLPLILLLSLLERLQHRR